MATTLSRAESRGSFWRSEPGALPIPNPSVPFAGRIGANHKFSADCENRVDRDVLEKYPDAAPWVPLRDALSLKGFLQIEIWKAAVIEGVGRCTLSVLVWLVISLVQRAEF